MGKLEIIKHIPNPTAGFLTMRYTKCYNTVVYRALCLLKLAFLKLFNNTKDAK